MKKLLTIVLASAMLSACEKGKNAPHCPTLAADAVPSTVTNAFQAKHPGVNVQTWFNKDNKGYAALFTQNGNQELDMFDDNGNLQKEEVDNNNNQQGDNQDNSSGCKCETGTETGD